MPFERYMLADDRAGWPMTFPLRFGFSGRVDLGLLRAALPQAVKRHPLLDSRLAGRGRGALWRPAGKIPLDHTESPNGFSAPAAIDLHAGRPFRWRWRPLTDGGNLELLFHHAAVDGIGAISFVGDWLAAYEREVNPESTVRIKALRTESLSARDDANASPSAQPASAWRSLAATARECRRFFARRITPMASPGPDRDGSAAAGQPAALLVGSAIPQDASQALRAHAKSLGVTLNDLAMRELFLALLQWNQEWGDVGRWYRITMPANLRDRTQLRMPAANRIGYAFLDRDLSGAVDPDALLASIAGENASIRQHRLASMFLSTLALADKTPGLMTWLTRPTGVTSTAVFTNVGDPVRRFYSRLPSTGGRVSAGDLTLESFEGAPPTRPGTHAAFCLSQYAGGIQLCVSPAASHLGHVDATRLLELWRHHLTNNLAE